MERISCMLGEDGLVGRIGINTKRGLISWERKFLWFPATWISCYGFQPWVVRESSNFYFYFCSNRNESTFNTRTYKAAAHRGIMQIPSTSLELNLQAKKYTGTNKIRKQQIDLDILTGSHQTSVDFCTRQIPRKPT